MKENDLKVLALDLTEKLLAGNTQKRREAILGGREFLISVSTMKDWRKVSPSSNHLKFLSQFLGYENYQDYKKNNKLIVLKWSPNLEFGTKRITFALLLLLFFLIGGIFWSSNKSAEYIEKLTNAVTNALITKLDDNEVSDSTDDVSEEDVATPTFTNKKEQGQAPSQAAKLKELNREEPKVVAEKPKRSPPKTSKVNFRKKLDDIGIAWEAKSFAEAMTRGDLQTVNYFVKGGFPPESVHDGASILLYAYHPDASDPIGVTKILIENGFDFNTLLTDRRLMQGLYDGLPFGFSDKELPKYSSYGKVFQGSLVLWLSQLLEAFHEQNNEMEVVRMLKEREQFPITARFLYGMYGPIFRPLHELFKTETEEVHFANYSEEKELKEKRYWPKTISRNEIDYYPIFIRGDQILVQTMDVEFVFLPLDETDLLSKIKSNYLERKRYDRLLEPMKKENQIKGELRSQHTIFLILELGDQLSERLIEIQSQWTIAKSMDHNFAAVIIPEDKALEKQLAKESGKLNLDGVFHFSNKEIPIINYHTLKWQQGYNVFELDKNGDYIQGFDTPEKYFKFLMNMQ